MSPRRRDALAVIALDPLQRQGQWMTAALAESYGVAVAHRIMRDLGIDREETEIKNLWYFWYSENLFGGLPLEVRAQLAPKLVAGEKLTLADFGLLEANNETN